MISKNVDRNIDRDRNYIYLNRIIALQLTDDYHWMTSSKICSNPNCRFECTIAMCQGKYTFVAWFHFECNLGCNLQRWGFILWVLAIRMFDAGIYIGIYWVIYQIEWNWEIKLFLRRSSSFQHLTSFSCLLNFLSFSLFS